jgi:hypothetical protein
LQKVKTVTVINILLGNKTNRKMENEEEDVEQQTLSGKKSDRKPTSSDPVADWILKMYYTFNQKNMKAVKFGVVGIPIAAILLFTIFISNTTSNVIAFSALIISLVFMAISMWLLGWILDKDQGTRAMQDISDPIKEGAEGFFIT